LFIKLVSIKKLYYDARPTKSQDLHKIKLDKKLKNENDCFKIFGLLHCRVLTQQTKDSTDFVGFILICFFVCWICCLSLFCIVFGVRMVLVFYVYWQSNMHF